MQLTDTIINALTSLHSDTSHNWPEETRGRAPHKPLLLLSVMDGMEQGWIKGNNIELSQSLVETFFTYWKVVMGEERVTTIALPFFYMKSEPFWDLVYKKDKPEYQTAPSLGGLKDRADYAILDDQFFRMMSDPQQREMIRALLARSYFSPEVHKKLAAIRSFNYQSYDYSRQLEAFAAEPFRKDHTQEESVKYRTTQTQVRDAGFSKTVRSVYNYTCAVCRSKVITQGGSTLVDGAHIIPRSQSNNDDPRNGLALCKSHHWMFDEYMLTVTPDYTIRLSKWLKEENNNVGNLWDLNKESILLPEAIGYQPAREALENHYLRFKEVQ
ncbi:HNH endonuclease [Rhodohalobacter sp. 614A]|uniref:HNH endonuclease n=1 Tax=Rhodohalobacter sp. 614A TaxID=2908649 RepID=UPI001F368FC4|nr:HNH endonuclease [Rhodohalobacter sp. 614A]